MDTKSLINKLREVFDESNKGDKRYSQIWLSEVDFGGLYHSDKFVLNLKAEHEIQRHFSEIKDIITMLGQKAKEELKSIWRVKVYQANEEIQIESQDLLVLEESSALQ